MLPRVLPWIVPAAWVLAVLAFGGFFADEEGWTPPPPSVTTTRILEALAAEPEVLVLGNSQAMSAVDLDEVAKTLDVGDRIAAAGIPAARAPTLYAALKHSVFGRGHTPRLVLLPVSPTHLLETDPPEGERLTTLLEHLTAPDPVLDAKVFDKAGAWPAWDRMVARARTARDGWLSWWTSRPAMGVDATDPDAAMDAARDAVFGEVAGSNLVLNARMIPVVEGGGAAGGLSADASIASSLLPDLVALCAEHGARLVVVSVPQKMASLATPPAVTHRMALWLRDHGAGFLDLERVPVSAEAWLDEGHMNAAGRDAFTAALTAAIGPLDLMRDGALPAFPVPVPPPKVTRTGPTSAPKLTALQTTDNPCLVHLKVEANKLLADPFLSSHGFGNASPLTLTFRGRALPGNAPIKDDTPCTGRFQHGADKVLVALPAGATGVTLADFAVAWTQDAPHTRRWSSLPDADATQDAWWIPADGALELVWDEVPEIPEGARLQVLLVETKTHGPVGPQLLVEDTLVPLTRWGHLWMADVPLTAGTPPFSVSFKAAPGGGDVFVRSLLLQPVSGLPSVLVGRLGDRPDLQPVSGGLDVRSTPEWVSHPLSAPQAASADVLSFAVPAPHDVLTEARLRAAIDDNRFVNCVPLEIWPGTSPGEGRLPQVIQRVAGTAAARVPADGQTWTLNLRSRRMCFGHTWVQPGEVLTFIPRVAKGLAVDADTLHLVAYPFLHGTAATVRVLVNDAVVGAFPLSASGAQTLALPTPVAAWPESVKLEVTAPPDGWVAVGASTLGASTIPPEAWFARPIPMPPSREPDAPADPVNAKPPAAPKLLGQLPQSLDTTLSVHGVGALFSLPPQGPSITQRPEGGARIEAPAGVRPMVCLPPVPAAAALDVDASVRLAGPLTPVMLDVRWLDSGGRPLKDASGKPILSTLRSNEVGAIPTPLHLSADAPASGAALAQACLRRGDGAAALEVLVWRMTSR
jgi:hypothetical protein